MSAESKAARTARREARKQRQRDMDAWFDAKGVPMKFRAGTPLSKGVRPWTFPPKEPGTPPSGGSGSARAS
jgi:hypothetical protein